MNERTVCVGAQEYRVTAVSSGLGRWMAHIDHIDRSAMLPAIDSTDIQLEFETIKETLDIGVRLCKEMAKDFQAPYLLRGPARSS
ncbi:hypothetical protein PWR63_23440 [Paraburkholderia sp. A2WS-5]|uniref:hypothetical protein n=1 Tax=unclassified Paraburkholderia TaxID=2615204 RepID=UPI003B7A0C8E